VETLKHYLGNVGFVEIHLIKKENSEEIIKNWNLGEGIEKAVFSTYIKATKPL